MPVRPLRLLAAIVVLLGTMSSSAFAATFPPADGAFYRTWERTDAPVADGDVARTWMWGPDAFSDTLMEPYLESGEHGRMVQYFDKSRMEITHPEAVDDGVWYVTNGLLVVEMVTGALQIGDDAFLQLDPAMVKVAGDPDDPTGPTYATFGSLLDRDPVAVGTTYGTRLNRDGSTVDEPGFVAQGVTAAVLDEVTQHTIAAPFWEFMQSSGLVRRDGENVEDQLFVDPYHATGRPITEAYWATVKVAQTYRDVLMQCFERRCLTYTPGNPEGWVVEAGNVGQHYYQWRNHSGFVFAIKYIPAASGGTLDLDGVSVEIPAGALSHDTLVTIAPARNVPSEPGGHLAVGAAYALGLSGATLQAPVTVTLPFTPGLVPGNVTPDLIVLGRMADGDDTWTLLPGTALDGMITVQTDHLSTWQVFAPTGGNPVADDVAVTAVPSVVQPVTLRATDSDSARLTFEIVEGPTHGTLTTMTPTATCTPVGDGVECTAEVEYTGDYSYTGSDSFTYRASDGIFASEPAVVSVTLEYPSEPYQSDPISASEGGTFEIPGQLKITFPPDVLECDVIIFVVTSQGATDAMDSSEDPIFSVSNMYDISLEAADPEICPYDFFEGQITLEIWYDPRVIPPDSSEFDVFVAYEDFQFEGFWFEMPGEVDTERKIVIVLTGHLSKWNVFVR